MSASPATAVVQSMILWSKSYLSTLLDGTIMTKKLHTLDHFISGLIHVLLQKNFAPGTFYDRITGDEMSGFEPRYLSQKIVPQKEVVTGPIRVAIDLNQRTSL